jgi:hypothetical protein
VDWQNERWVKLYTRDSADWLALSWQAQGLFCLILRKVNRAGVIDLGRHAAKGLAAHFGGPAAWASIKPHLDELIEDGCVVVDGSTLTVPRFVEAQEATQSAAARKRTERERRDDGVTKRDQPSQNVTESHEKSHGVTDGHAASRDVTNRTEQTRTDETQSTPNGVLPPQPPAGATTAAAEKAANRKPSRPDDAPPAEGSPAAAVVAAVEGAGFLRGLVKRPCALGNAAVAAFPGVDLAAQVAKANGWCVMNPAKAPRSNGDAFLWRWLQTAQNDVANRAAREGQRSAVPDLFAPKAAPTARAVNANDLRREHQSLAALPMRPA